MRFRADGWIFSPFVFMSRNVDLGLSLGTAAAFTAGRYVQRSNRRETLVAFGAAVGKEELTDFFRHDHPRTAVDLSLLTFPELNRWGRVRANATARLKQPTTPSTVSRRWRMSAGTTSA
jgi:sugar/nucleoside kinase (ribokinase family)